LSEPALVVAFKAPNGPDAAAFSAPGVLATVLLVSA
jgi:hypothetical protein